MARAHGHFSLEKKLRVFERHSFLFGRVSEPSRQDRTASLLDRRREASAQRGRLAEDQALLGSPGSTAI